MDDSTLTNGDDAPRLAEDIDQTFDRLRDHLHEVDRQTRAFVERYPIVSLLGAIVGGYLVGRVVSRR